MAHSWRHATVAHSHAHGGNHVIAEVLSIVGVNVHAIVVVAHGLQGGDVAGGISVALVGQHVAGSRQTLHTHFPSLIR